MKPPVNRKFIWLLSALTPCFAQSGAITVDYPANRSIFPPDIAAPTFLWRDAVESNRSWRIRVVFADGAGPLVLDSAGERMQIGKMDPRTIAPSNKPPELTPQQAAAHTWKPDAATWETIRKHSVDRPATVKIEGISTSGGRMTSQGVVTIETSPSNAP